ncbi:MAG: hypothetical protein V3R94_11155, partial [Acidobacteriota bacterium]
EWQALARRIMLNRHKGKCTLCVFLIILGSCFGPPESGKIEEAQALDSEAFLYLAATLIVDDAMNGLQQIDGNADGKVIAIDPKTIPGNSPQLAQLIQNKLSEAGIPWVEIDLKGDFQNLPGNWGTRDGGFKTNWSHILLTVDVRSGALIRNLRWSFYCGELCARGKSIDFRWEDGNWIQTLETYIRS